MLNLYLMLRKFVKDGFTGAGENIWLVGGATNYGIFF